MFSLTLTAFSTLHHGFSLRSLYRNCQDHDGPSLLVIQSQNQEWVLNVEEKLILPWSGSLRRVLVRPASSERALLRHGRVLALLLLLGRHEDLQLEGRQQLHHQGQPQLPRRGFRYVTVLFQSRRNMKTVAIPKITRASDSGLMRSSSTGGRSPSRPSRVRVWPRRVTSTLPILSSGLSNNYQLFINKLLGEAHETEILWSHHPPA